MLIATSLVGFGALSSYSVQFVAVIDSYSIDPVLPIDFYTAMKTGQFNHVPIMTGTVENDGAVIVGLSAIPNEITEEYWNQRGTDLLYINPSYNKSEIREEDVLQASIMKRFYLGQGDISLKDSIFDVVNMETDGLYLSPEQKVAEFASNFVPVYNYRLKPYLYVNSIYVLLTL